MPDETGRVQAQRTDWSVCQTCFHYNNLHGLLRLNGKTLDPCDCCYVATTAPARTLTPDTPPHRHA